jgi:hypothetical protein
MISSTATLVSASLQAHWRSKRERENVKKKMMMMNGGLASTGR